MSTAIRRSQVSQRAVSDHARRAMSPIVGQYPCQSSRLHIRKRGLKPMDQNQRRSEAASIGP